MRRISSTWVSTRESPKVLESTINIIYKNNTEPWKQ